MVNRGKIFYQK